MPRRHLTAFALLALTAWAAACQDLNKQNQSSSGTSTGLTQSEFVEAFQKLTCSNFKQCCEAVGLTLDTTKCSALFSGAGESGSNAVFNPKYGEACLDELDAKLSCGTTNNAPSCSLVYTGMLAPGEQCTAALDCARPSNGVANCDRARGVCVVGIRGELYQDCQQSCEVGRNGAVACVWGPASNAVGDGTSLVNCFANDGLICGDNGRCVYLARAGEFCTDDSSCSRELYCATGSGAYNAACEPRRAVGQNCIEYTAPCVSGAYCSAGTCLARKANGQRCLSNEECLGSCSCADGDCTNNGVCVDPIDPVGSYITLLILAGSCDPAASK